MVLVLGYQFRSMSEAFALKSRLDRSYLTVLISVKTSEVDTISF
jgi:hypothetical protein